MKYFVIYRVYNHPNRFDDGDCGCWENNFQEFDSLDAAKGFYYAILSNSDYWNIHLTQEMKSV